MAALLLDGKIEPPISVHGSGGTSTDEEDA